MPKTEAFDRSVVLGKITDLFLEKGFNGASMQDIVDVSGLNRSSLYNSFGDKYQLFLTTIDYHKKQVQRPLIEKAKTLPATDALRFLLEAELTNHDGKYIGSYLINCTTEMSMTDPNIYRMLHSNKKHLVDVFKHIIDNGKKSGKIKSDLDSKKGAIYLYSSMQGIRLTSMLSTSKREITSIVDMILKGL